MHGLRKNAGMELAEAGAEVLEIMSVLGHKIAEDGAVLLRAGTAGRMNENAIAKWDAALERKTPRSAKLCARWGEQSGENFSQFC